MPRQAKKAYERKKGGRRKRITEGKQHEEKGKEVTKYRKNRSGRTRKKDTTGF